MELGEEAQVLLKPHWEKIVENWGGKIPEFVSLDYVKKYLPLLQIPDEEEGILIKPADGYTITESDVSFITISDYNGGVLELGEDGNVWLKFVHQHKDLYGYEPVTENTHNNS